MNLFQWITLVISLLAIVSSILSIFINVHLKKNVDVKLTQYYLTNEEQNRILRNLFELEDFLDELIAQYSVEANELPNKMTPGEKIKANKFISEINLGLSKMYIVMGDKKYKTFANNWSPATRKLSEIRHDLTILMRKTQHPGTEFDQIGDIKLIYKLK